MMARRRVLALLLALVLVAGAAATTVALIVSGEEDGEETAGRVAVIDGCGLLHMWQDGSDQRRLCLPEIWGAVSVSADGDRLAWDTQSGGASGVMVGNVDGRDPRPLLLSPGANLEPSLAPDGDSLAFLHSPRDDGRYDIWTTSTSLANAEQVTTSRDVSSVAWSPAGDLLAYVRDWSPETLEGTIVLVKTDGTGERQLGRGDAPAWAPDGDRLAFVRSGNIWTVEADGSQPKLLVRNGHAPGWSRDGRFIAFMRAARCGEAVCPEQVVVVPESGGRGETVGPRFADSRRVLWLPDPTR
jgi:Tol biopolymer transport system component